MWWILFNFYIFPAMVVIELWFSRKRQWSNYSWSESLSSLALRLLQIGMTFLLLDLFNPIYSYAYANRMLSWQLHPVLEHISHFAAAEFYHYSSHCFSHKVPLGWAGHIVHHSPKKLNFVNSRRVNFLDPLILLYFYFALYLLLGFKIEMLTFYVLLNLQYQVWIHTDIIPKLGFLDKILNTPSNHRVHHGMDPIYLNKNFGGVTMFFDHLFGTYQPELDHVKMEYGIAGGVPSQNPFRIAFYGMEKMYKYWRSSRPSLFSLLFKFPSEERITRKNVA